MKLSLPIRDGRVACPDHGLTGIGACQRCPAFHRLKNRGSKGVTVVCEPGWRTRADDPSGVLTLR
jgi:hypothetical protein